MSYSNMYLELHAAFSRLREELLPAHQREAEGKLSGIIFGIIAGAFALLLAPILILLFLLGCRKQWVLLGISCLLSVVIWLWMPDVGVYEYICVFFVVGILMLASYVYVWTADRVISIMAGSSSRLKWGGRAFYSLVGLYLIKYTSARSPLMAYTSVAEFFTEPMNRIDWGVSSDLVYMGVGMSLYAYLFVAVVLGFRLIRSLR